jgi:hypothetical protein
MNLTSDEHAIVMEALRDYCSCEVGGIGCYLEGDDMEHVKDPELREKYMRHRRAAVRLYLRLLDETQEQSPHPPSPPHTRQSSA